MPPVPERNTTLLSAALRHVRDARNHMRPGPDRSIDQAYHLAGYGPECARKATLVRGWLDKLIGHELSGGPAYRLAIELDPIAARYDTAQWSTEFPRLMEWSPDSRYVATGTYGEAVTNALLNQAESAVDSIAIALWTDGTLTNLPW